MGLLDRIFKKFNREEPDPTLEWAEYREMELVVVPNEMRIGSLKFGDPLSAAEFLGKPSSFAWGYPGYCELVYAEGGFQLDFDMGRLVFVAFYLDHHVLEPEGEFAFSAPVVVLSGGERVELSKRLKAPDLVEIFGQPKEIDKDSDETILFFESTSMTMEFELRPESHTLAKWNLFPVVSDDD
jgi:hypothetical protein